MKTFNQQNLQPIKRIDTGIYKFNEALGGGIPVGRLVEVFSKKSSSGKSTLSLQCIAQMQRDKLKCAYIDVEQTFDPEYSTTLGVDLDKLLFPVADVGVIMSGEKVWETVENLSKDGVDFIVIDSIALMVAEAEMAGAYDQQHMALAGRINSQAIRKLTPLLAVNNTALMCINQSRANIGVFGHGDKFVTPGGKALEFAYSIRVELAKIKTNKAIVDGESVQTGSEVRITCKKNKTAPTEGMSRQLTTVLGRGFDPKINIIGPAIDAKIIKKEGNTLYLDDKKLGVASRLQLTDEDYNIINTKLMNQ